MKKLIITILLIYILNINLYSKEENEKKDKIKIKPVLNFYFKQKATSDFYYDIYSNINFNLLNLKNEFNLKISIPLKIWTFSFNLNNLNVIDFMPFIYNRSEITTPDILFNSLVLSLENKIKIKKAITFNFNFETGLNAPVFINPYLSLFLNPIIDLEGDYYFGYFWEIEQSFPIDIYFDEFNSKNIIISNYAKIGFEFFRFYGPKKFKFGIMAENTFKLFIPLSKDTTAILEKTYNNLIKAGIYLKFFNFIYSLYFVYENIGNADYGITDYQKLGFNTGLDFTKKIAIVSFDYTFTYNYSNYYINNFEHKFDFYVKFRY